MKKQAEKRKLKYLSPDEIAAKRAKEEQRRKETRDIRNQNDVLMLLKSIDSKLDKLLE